MKNEAKKKNSSKDLANLVVKGIQEKKGKNITVMDLQKVHGAVTNFFVIASANSDTQLSAIHNSVDKVVSDESGEKPWQSEGRTNKEWILLDYGDVVVHLFKKDIRSFYNLEGLWGDAKITHIKDEE